MTHRVTDPIPPDTFAHDTVNGWCCACEADIALMETEIAKEGSVAEIEARLDELEALDRKAEIVGMGYAIVRQKYINNRIAILYAQLKQLRDTGVNKP
jgi:hypothetical protein